MGSSSSKQNAAQSSSSSPAPSRSPSGSPLPSFVRRTRSYRRKVFQSPCLRSRGNAGPQVSDIGSKSSVGNRCAIETMSDSSEMKRERSRQVKVQLPEELNCEISDAENDEWVHSRGGCMSSRVFSSRGLNPSSRFLSRLSIFPGNISFRLNRENSFHSTRPGFASSTRFPFNDEDEPSTSGLTSGNDRRQGCDYFSTCFTAQSPALPHADSATGNFLQNTSTRGALRDSVHAGLNSGQNSFSANDSSMEFAEERLANRRSVVGETVERNVRFSRSLSVGRLRERVLRRSSFLDSAFGLSEQGREARYPSHVGEGQILSGSMIPTSVENHTISSPASFNQGGAGMPGSIYGRQRFDVDTPRSREARYHDLLEYRSNFLERRRRIRSQVRALQRLGSRFENLSVHERSCILSGQHRSGHCTCRINPQEIDSNDDTSARASISRIVMLAEALFEVLDEIHQQSVVLSSRSSMSSLGSAPAPNEVVESLPLRLYSKLQKHVQDEVTQCYICLIEYEEGDSVRILPCHHEYHKTCIDKWLKEIHRVCPLCRGDVCRSDSLSANTQGL